MRVCGTRFVHKEMHIKLFLRYFSTDSSETHVMSSDQLCLCAPMFFTQWSAQKTCQFHLLCGDCSFLGRITWSTMPAPKQEQRVAIKFMFKEGLSAKQIHDRLLNVHGCDAVSRSTVQRWMIKFANSEAVTDAPRSGHPKHTAATTQAVSDFIQGNKRRTVRQTARHCNISNGLAHKIIRKDLRLQKKTSTWVPHLLNQAQKQKRVDMAMEALDVIEGRHEDLDIDFQHLITEDESWFWVWQPDPKQGNCQWLGRHEERPQVARQERSTKKVMLVVFFDRRGMVHHEWVLDGRGIGSLVYREILDRFRENLRRRRPEAWCSNWGLLHDGAPAHRALPTHRYLEYHAVQVMPHPGYSPDISPPDYWLFACLKKMVRGVRYHNIDALQNTVEAAMKAIPAQDFLEAMERYPDRLRRVIAAEGAYFEN